MTRAKLFLDWLEAQVGKEYRLGATVILSQESLGNPHAFASQRAWDCSECVKAGVWSAGVPMITGDDGNQIHTAAFDPAFRQYQRSHHIPVAAGIATPGALLFVKSVLSYPMKPLHIGHVAVSLGNGEIIEARGRKWGVVKGPFRKSFNLAAKIPELYKEI